MPPKGSIFRGPNAQHFQLVHRSQQDPLINDPEASQRVLKPMGRGNDSRKTEISLAELEATIDKSKIRANEGEAALYGITYDDSAYDYMQHLKPVGGSGGGVESFLIAAPSGGSGVASGMKGGKGKFKARADDEMFQLPESVLPSRHEISVQEARARNEAIPLELQGLQPDMDPHLRQVLEALDDDAFVDDEDDEGWFNQLVKGGERDNHEEVPWEFTEWGVDESGKPVQRQAEQNGEREETWEDRFEAFKQEQARAPEEPSEFDPEEMSEMADTVGSLTSNLADMMVRGGKKRHGKRGPSDASGMSMSSSSMFRNQGLRDLDDRFDKIERDYEYDDDEEEEGYEDWSDDDGTASIAASNFSVSSRFSLASHASRASTSVPPELSREDFNAIMDDFLENYEVVGRRLRPALGGTALSGPEKLKVLRSAIEGEGDFRDDNRKRIKEIEKEEMGKGRTKLREEKVKIIGEEEQKWDVETILIATRTNTENHPALIRDPTRKIRTVPAPPPPPVQREEDSEDDSGSETEREGGPRVTIARTKGESADEKKARKAAVKAERSARRAEKKSHKETFSIERKRQLKSHNKMVGDGRAADVPAGREGVYSLR
ncbi:protein LTV1 [Cryptococcus bacillisporus CA1873]|uniref:Protein LTV1 n=1 Tax=Cryptococcus bacillisporus CA1873 TaxID=1296111 RepID=A0ABR5BG06_CRYGA|nr:protein LTV1 [Cryptococcus bacillisporus CA1873]|eukprot:KIR68127.1 protein LTV1 [Cryptococcus gattii CA1873]